MDKDYFDGKKKMTCESLKESIGAVESVLGKVECWQYSVPMIFDVDALHEKLKDAERAIRNARRDFEKVRWASSRSDLKFEEWISQGPYSDLF